MALEIQVLAWDRHEFVAELNWVMRSHFKKWIADFIQMVVFWSFFMLVYICCLLVSEF